MKDGASVAPEFEIEDPQDCGPFQITMAGQICY